MPRRTASIVVTYGWRALCRLLLHLLPARQHAVVHGWPDDEGNAVEVVRALARRYRGRTYRLLDDTSYAGPASLVLDRPIGFYVPDLEELQRRRGLNVEDLALLLPGPRIDTAQDARCFLEDIAREPRRLRPSTDPGHARIGVATGGGAADRLLDWLDDFQRAQGREVLFPQPVAGGGAGPRPSAPENAPGAVDGRPAAEPAAS